MTDRSLCCQLLFTVFLFFLFTSLAYAQEKYPLSYYLPDIAYNKDIPAPESVLGYQIGEWHLSHDQQLMYLRMLAASSPRLVLKEYARTYENRPLVYLTITSEDNHRRLEELKVQHRQLSDPAVAEKLPTDQMPVVIYQGFSIHGNEASGGNAAPLVAYFLAAAQTEEVEQMLSSTIILLDPCFNPDGFQRFSTWVNMHKNQVPATDPQDREFNEKWPGGRTNHYWFDLNRDWLPLQHPESRGRIALFHDWKPNMLTDHHEMGSNATFFFMPGVPQRTHPLTPPENQELTARISEFHARALDGLGSLYYTREGYDDFYYGKGSTYPDAHGGIGILFEQASSRGFLRQTVHGELSFPFTIRNQVRTALSTQKAAVSLKTELLDYQRNFYNSALEEARKDNRRAIVFGEKTDNGRLRHFLDILKRHQIAVYHLSGEVKAGGTTYEKENAYIVPLAQARYRMIRALFDTNTSFKDSIFYDVSSWTLPLAFNIAYAWLSAKDFQPDLIGERLDEVEEVVQAGKPERSDYAYLLEWDDFYAPAALYYLLKNGLKVKVGAQQFTAGGKAFERGTILIPVQRQGPAAAEVYRLIQEASKLTGGRIYGVKTGLTADGMDLGSNNFEPLELPKVLLLTGEGVSAYEAGEVWHLLDQRFGIPLTMVEVRDLGQTDLSDYNTLILVNGDYAKVSSESVAKLKEWIRAGGVLIAQKNALKWAGEKGLARITVVKPKEKNENERRPYGKRGEDYGSGVIGGAIFEARLDLSHPLAFGYSNERIPVFHRGTLFVKPAKNPYASPLLYSDQPLISGYINRENSQLISGSAGIVVSGLGKGRIICLANDLNFRAFWFGTTKIFANALFFGRTISSMAVEKVVEKKDGK